MTIAEAREKCKMLVSKIPRDALIIGVLVLASSASFGLGYLAGLDAAGQGNDVVLGEESSFTTTATEGKIVASKNGTKYYLPSCAGVDKISDANKIWFVSPELAAAAGYTPAANCKGL